MSRILVAGSGGFIGHWLVKRLKEEGHFVRGVDIKYPEFESTPADEFWISDLREPANAEAACRSMDDVYQLAADMGGIGYITVHLALIARNNTLINLNMLEGARINAVKRYLYTSSACVYNQNLQDNVNATPLKESDAWPSLPERGYGLEKLYAEEMTDYYRSDYGLDVRVVRFHNVYGPLGTYDGGREKSPAALCRKIAQSGGGGTASNFVEIWGDGMQTRTYMFIDDCVEGLRRIMKSGYQKPINLGTDELVTIDQLAYLIGDIAKKPIVLKHVDGPQGVRGRNSDNTLARKILGWEPSIKLEQGLVPTYNWIEKQVNG